MKRMNDTDKRKQQILKAAEQLFLQHGYQGVSVEEIARACGVVKGTVLHYFESKEGLFQEVLLSRRNLALEHLQKEVDNGSEGVHEILKKFINDCYEQLSKTYEISKDYLSTPMGKYNFNMMRLPIYEGIEKLLEKLIEHGMETGELPEINSRLRAHALAFAIFGITSSGAGVDEMIEEIRCLMEKSLEINIDE